MIMAQSVNISIEERAGRFFYVVNGAYAILTQTGALVSYGRREDAERMQGYWVGVGVYPR